MSIASSGAVRAAEDHQAAGVLPARVVDDVRRLRAPILARHLGSRACGRRCRDGSRPGRGYMSISAIATLPGAISARTSAVLTASVVVPEPPLAAAKAMTRPGAVGVGRGRATARLSRRRDTGAGSAQHERLDERIELALVDGLADDIVGARLEQAGTRDSTSWLWATARIGGWRLPVSSLIRRQSRASADSSRASRMSSCCSLSCDSAIPRSRVTDHGHAVALERSDYRVAAWPSADSSRTRFDRGRTLRSLTTSVLD